MSEPMVIAHHLIWTGYGWWLPNDPRGSMSHTIACDVIAELGDLHYGRKTVQPASPVIREFYQRARDVLKHPLQQFDAGDLARIAEAFVETISVRRYTCYACAIMRDHVHVLIRKHRDRPAEMIHHLQEASRLRLQRQVPRFAGHPVWGGPGWDVFQHDPSDVRRTIAYIEGNPAKLRLAPQRWAFVKPCDDWPFHVGHSPNSPYVRRTRRD